MKFLILNFTIIIMFFSSIDVKAQLDVEFPVQVQNLVSASNQHTHQLSTATIKTEPTFGGGILSAIVACQTTGNLELFLEYQGSEAAINVDNEGRFPDVIIRDYYSPTIPIQVGDYYVVSVVFQKKDMIIGGGGSISYAWRVYLNDYMIDNTLSVVGFNSQIVGYGVLPRIDGYINPNLTTPSSQAHVADDFSVIFRNNDGIELRTFDVDASLIDSDDYPVVWTDLMRPSPYNGKYTDLIDIGCSYDLTTTGDKKAYIVFDNDDVSEVLEYDYSGTPPTWTSLGVANNAGGLGVTSQSRIEARGIIQNIDEIHWGVASISDDNFCFVFNNQNVGTSYDDMITPVLGHNGTKDGARFPNITFGNGDYSGNIGNNDYIFSWHNVDPINYNDAEIYVNRFSASDGSIVLNGSNNQEYHIVNNTSVPIPIFGAIQLDSMQHGILNNSSLSTTCNTGEDIFVAWGHMWDGIYYKYAGATYGPGMFRPEAPTTTNEIKKNNRN